MKIQPLSIKRIKDPTSHHPRIVMVDTLEDELVRLPADISKQKLSKVNLLNFQEDTQEESDQNSDDEKRDSITDIRNQSIYNRKHSRLKKDMHKRNSNDDLVLVLK